MAHTDIWTAIEHVYSLINVTGVTDILTGGIHRGLPPSSADLVDSNGLPKPYATIRAVPRGDLQIVNGRRVWTEVVCDVVAVGRDLQWDALDRAAAAFDALLQATGGSTTSGRVFSCQRISQISFDEADEGIQYVYVGGSYRITARAT